MSLGIVEINVNIRESEPVVCWAEPGKRVNGGFPVGTGFFLFFA